ncbi:MAG: NAD(P)/FAD-dependent oxidoreductase [Cyanobacteria bacterium P01_D01_bin.44]
MPEVQRIAVIGGGAAGFFGAIATAAATARVTLFEAGPAPLAKVRISGGGRCNVTHHCFDPRQLVQNYPRGSKALLGPFSRFQPKDTVAWFRRHGVLLKTEADGRMFPTTDDSATIVDCLRQAADELGVRVRTRSAVVSVQKTGDRFQVGLKSGEVVECDRILLATGSSPQGYRIAQSLGHTIEPPVPSLFTLNVPDKSLHQLSGLSIDPVDLRLKVAGVKKPLLQTGPLLITHWGFSGPAILKLSAWGARVLHGQRYQATLQVNWLPGLTQEQLRHALMQAKGEMPRRAISNYNPFSLPKRFWQYLCERCELSPQLTWANLSKQSMNCLVTGLNQGHYSIQGKGVFKEEFVTCGGVRLREVDFKLMSSRSCPGLYFAGEILDIDGITGGFNFQSAWTTGWLAGQAMVRDLDMSGV